MGVDLEYFTVYGIRYNKTDHPEKMELWKKLDYNYGSFEQFVFDDNYDGEWVVIGKALFRSGDVRRMDLNDVVAEIDITRLDEYKKEVVDIFHEEFGDEYDSLIEGDFKLYTFLQLS